jgi:hypothetical protein
MRLSKPSALPIEQRPQGMRDSYHKYEGDIFQFEVTLYFLPRWANNRKRSGGHMIEDKNGRCSTHLEYQIIGNESDNVVFELQSKSNLEFSNLVIKEITSRVSGDK